VAAAQQESQQLRQQLQQIQQLHREQTQQIVREKERELGRMRQQVEIHEQERANFVKRLLEKDGQLHKLEGQLLLRSKDKNHQEAAGKVKLAWREGKKAPFTYVRLCDAVTVVECSKVYFQGNIDQLFTYNISESSWLKLPKCPFRNCSLAILNGQLSTIGGQPFTNKLMILTNECKWTEKFPPMPTKRRSVTAVCTGTLLIVAGGIGENGVLATVEVLNFETSRWSTAVDLPEPLFCCSAAVHGDQLYVLGGGMFDKSVYTCSVSALLQTCTQKSSLEEGISALSLSRSLVGTFKRALSLSNSSSGVWSKLPDLPVTWSTCVTFCGQLLAVGGGDSDNKPTTAVYMYNQATNSWNVISHMTTARRDCFVTLLPNNQLMVVGGQTKINDEWTYSDSVELGSLHVHCFCASQSHNQI
jgi:hypothetical protein